MSNDELLSIFREEVTDHLAGLNDGLLKVEMIQGDEKIALLREMNRLAHSMKGAARAVGVGRIETISHYMEEVFHYALNKGMDITPDIADAVYDGLDLIQNTLDEDDTDEEVIAEVLANLERIVTLHSTDNGAKPKKRRKADKRATQDSEEMPVISIPPIATQLPPDFEPLSVAPLPAPAQDAGRSTAVPLQPPSATEFATPVDMNTELMNIFRGEMDEHLASLNAAMLQAETMQGDEKMTLLREMNRVAHSMKGASRAVGFGLIEAMGHHLEEVFGAALIEHIQLTPDSADTLYDSLDIIQNTLDGETTEAAIVQIVLTNLARIAQGTAPLARGDDADEFAADAAIEVNETPAVAPPSAPSPQPTSKPATDLNDLSDLLNTLSQEARPPAATQSTIGLRLTEKFRAISTAEKTLVDGVSVPLNAGADAPAAGTTSTMMLRPTEETIRVAVPKLDSLMGETSELIVARMQGEARQRTVRDLQRFHARWRREWRSVRASYIRLARRLQEQGAEAAAEMHTLFRFLQTNEDYLNDTNRELTQLGQLLAQDNMTLATLADNLQENVADLRMMPFETIIGGFQRMVRDLARDTHKQVQLDVAGAHVEIDKTVLDALKDPLMHLLRNSVDHGLETPHQRELAGKIPVGHIYVVVEQRGTEIVIKVQDDGRGIDVHRIKRKAVAASIMTEAEAAALDDDAAKLLIFESGFSTSDQVTAISGRGLGMDIVRDRVESLRGRISVQSVFGRGTTMVISVPVSLTRIRAIMLRVGEEDYAVPSTMVTRMETLPRSAMFTAEGREMVMLNQRPMPLVSLGALLDAPGLAHDRPEMMTLLALTAADRAVAFEVEGLSSEMELVLKPLGPELANAPYVAGASLLGSGEVLLILDANDLVRRALGGTAVVRRGTGTGRVKEQRRMRVLVVDDSITTRTLEKNILEAIGFEVHVAIDGAEAWTVLGDFTPDVIISDVEMPNVNGLELTRRIKSHAHTQDIPVILLTSLGKPEQREEGLRAGADAYLIKSRFDQGELLETIQSVM